MVVHVSECVIDSKKIIYSRKMFSGHFIVCCRIDGSYFLTAIRTSLVIYFRCGANIIQSNQSYVWHNSEREIEDSIGNKVNVEKSVLWLASQVKYLEKNYRFERKLLILRPVVRWTICVSDDHKKGKKTIKGPLHARCVNEKLSLELQLSIWADGFVPNIKYSSDLCGM